MFINPTFLLLEKRKILCKCYKCYYATFLCNHYWSLCTCPISACTYEYAHEKMMVSSLQNHSQLHNSIYNWFLYIWDVKTNNPELASLDYMVDAVKHDNHITGATNLVGWPYMGAVFLYSRMTHTNIQIIFNRQLLSVCTVSHRWHFLLQRCKIVSSHLHLYTNKTNVSISMTW